MGSTARQSTRTHADGLLAETLGERVEQAALADAPETDHQGHHRPAFLERTGQARELRLSPDEARAPFEADPVGQAGCGHDDVIRFFIPIFMGPSCDRARPAAIWKSKGASPCHPKSIFRSSSTSAALPPSIAGSPTTWRAPSPQVPGLLWKVWILDEERGRGGGVYLFADRVAATAYLEGPIVSRLRENPAVADVEVSLFDVLDGPSVITRGLSASGRTPDDARAPRAAV